MLLETEYENFLTQDGLWHSIPSHLKSDTSRNSIATIPSLTTNDSTLDVREKKSKDCYNFQNISKRMKQWLRFNLAKTAYIVYFKTNLYYLELV